jgi:carbon monoxide dehydrogenase subunit G
VKIHNEFTLPLPPAQAWILLNDIPRVARCAPGAALLEQKDDGIFVGAISVRLGPVLLSFKGTVAYREVDEANYRVVAEAAGTETKARGTAKADVTFSLAEAEEGTRVLVDTDLHLAGSIAQYGRGASVVKNTAQVIMDQFAKNFAQSIVDPETPNQPSQKPISGFKVLVKGVSKSIRG